MRLSNFAVRLCRQLTWLTFVSVLVISVPGCGSDSPLVETAPAEDAEYQSPTLRVRDFLPTIIRARDELKETYAHMLDRDALGFSRKLNTQISDDVARAVSRWQAEDTLGKVNSIALPVIIIFAFLLILGLLDRQSTRIIHQRQAQADTHGHSWVNQARRAMVGIVGRTVPVVILVPLSYFPVQAVFERAPWTIAITEILWLFIAFRVVHTALIASYSYRLFQVSDESAERLLVFGLWTTRLVFLWTGALAIVNAYDYHVELSALFAFLLNGSLVVVSAAMLFLKDEFVELLSLDDTVENRRLTSLAMRYYHPTILATMLLLVLATAGYVTAAKFVLFRAYGAVILIFGSQRAVAWMRRKIQQLVFDAKTRDEGELYQSIGTMLRGASMVAFVWLALLALKLAGPLVSILKVPLVVFGKSSISVMAVIDAAIIIALAILLGKILRAVLLTRVFPLFNVEIGVGYAVNTLMNYAVIVAGVLIGLAALGVDFSSLTVVMASLGVGIGLGLQDLTKNIVSGFILLFGRSVKKGDVVTVNDIYGRIDAVGARSVVIKTPDNFDMLIPSSQLVSGHVINWSYRDSYVRLHLPVGVTYGANPREVERVLLAAASQHPRIMKRPKPEVWLSEFGDSSVNFALLVYFDIRTITMDRLRGQLNFIVWDALTEAGMEIPFPQRDLHIKSGLPDLRELEFFREAPAHDDKKSADSEESAPEDESGSDEAVEAVEADDAETPDSA